MKETIKIQAGKRGYHLMVNGFYIHWGFIHEVKAIVSNDGIPYGATEWVSIPAMREFWKHYRVLTINSTKSPYQSVWGNLIK